MAVGGNPTSHAALIRRPGNKQCLTLTSAPPLLRSFLLSTPTSCGAVSEGMGCLSLHGSEVGVAPRIEDALAAATHGLAGPLLQLRPLPTAHSRGS